MLSNLELPLYLVASPVLSVLTKCIHLGFELWHFAVELACGHELPDTAVEDDVFGWN